MPLEVRQMDVQQHQLGAKVRNHGQRVGPGVGGARRVEGAVGQQEAGVHAGDFLAIVDDDGADLAHGTGIPCGRAFDGVGEKLTVNSAPPEADGATRPCRRAGLPPG